MFSFKRFFATGCFLVLFASSAFAEGNRTYYVADDGTAVAKVADLSALNGQPPRPRPSIIISPNRLLDVPARGGVGEVYATYSGGAADYVAREAADWVRVAERPVRGCIAVEIEPNPTFMTRKDTVVFWPVGGIGEPMEDSLYISQRGRRRGRGGRPTIRVTSVSGDFNMLPELGGNMQFNVTIGGGATGWVIGFLSRNFSTTSPYRGNGDGIVSVYYGDNPTTAIRRDTAVFRTVGGAGEAVEDTLFLTQRPGTAPYIRIDSTVPADLSMLSADGGSVRVFVHIRGTATGWDVATPPSGFTRTSAKWVRGRRAIIDYTLNSTGATREDTVVFYTTGGPTIARDTLIFTQSGGGDMSLQQTMILSPDRLLDVPATGGIGEIYATYSGGAMNYVATEAADWVRVAEWAVRGCIAVEISPNPTFVTRKDTVVFTPTGGQGVAVQDSLYISQHGCEPGPQLGPSVILETNWIDAPATGGMHELYVTFGGGATGYRVPERGLDAPASWVSLPLMGRRGSMDITLRPNLTSTTRYDTVVFWPTGGIGEPIEDSLFISQQGDGPGPQLEQSVVLETNWIDAPATGERRELYYTFGGGATGYRVPAEGLDAPASWVSLPLMGRRGSVEITLRPNPTSTTRYDTVVFWPTGGRGEPIEDSLFISQLGRDGIQPALRVSSVPADLSMLPSSGGRIRVSVRIRGAAGWDVLSPPSGFTTISAKRIRGGSAIIEYAPNPTGVTREDSVVFYTTGGSTIARDTLVVTQLGDEDLFLHQGIIVSPNYVMNVPATGETSTVRITYLEGATGYTIPASGLEAPASWVSVPAVALDGTLAVEIAPNSSYRTRRDTVVFTPTGGQGVAVQDSLFISQQGTRPRVVTVVLEPHVLVDIPAEGARPRIKVGIYASAGYIATEADDWVSVPESRTDGHITVEIAPNTTFVTRYDTVVFTPTGDVGDPFPDTLFITQLGRRETEPTGPSVTCEQSRLEVPAVGEASRISLTYNGGATGYTATGLEDWVVLSPGLTNGYVMVEAAPNPTFAMRESTITFMPTGGEGTPVSYTLHITQRASSPAINLGATEDVFADIRVVNPVSNDLVIYGLLVPTRMSLLDASGQEVLATTLEAGRQRTALPPIEPGMYFLILRTEEGREHSLRLLKE